MGLTTSVKSGHHTNIPIKNPENWEDISYIRKETRKDEVSAFGNFLPNYKLHPDDKLKINNFLAKKK